jgi:hypothetical protein
MNRKKIPALVCIWIVPLLGLVGLKLEARGPFLNTGSGSLAGFHLTETGRDSAVPDEGPQGIYVDTQGHDDNDSVVGNVTSPNHP